MATLILTSFLVALLTGPLAFYLLWRSRKEEGEAGLPPGPRGLPSPFLGPSLHHCFDELARTHGPVMRLRLGARLCVVLSSPAAAQEALKDHDAVFADHAAGMEPLNVSDLFPAALAWLGLQGIGRRTRRETAWLHRIFDSIVGQRRVRTVEGGDGQRRVRTVEGGGGGETAAAKKGQGFSAGDVGTPSERG